MNSGLKGWLWFVLVVNAISAISNLGLYAIASLIKGGVLLITLCLISSALIIAGTAILLFTRKKLGFYLMCACALINLILNIVMGNNLVIAIISAVLCPLITFLLMRKEWDAFQ